MSMWALITQRHIKDQYDMPCDCLESAYVEYFAGQGIQLLPVPNLGANRVVSYLKNISYVSGLVLSGGNDICPPSYGSLDAINEDCAPIRDETERALLTFAIKQRLPVLGICRGMQFINIYFGGTLLQDITTETEEPHAGGIHQLCIVDDKVAQYLHTSGWEMQSYHKQGITRATLALPLRAFITGSQGHIVEGLYHPEYPIAGIQFHPEREKKPASYLNRLIQAFKKQELYWKINK